eukprot:4719121-Amphidinium_carterae.1
MKVCMNSNCRSRANCAADTRIALLQLAWQTTLANEAGRRAVPRVDVRTWPGKDPGQHCDKEGSWDARDASFADLQLPMIHRHQ